MNGKLRQNCIQGRAIRARIIVALTQETVNLCAFKDSGMRARTHVAYLGLLEGCVILLNQTVYECSKAKNPLAKPNK